jgi:hypothetical protein
MDKNPFSTFTFVPARPNTQKHEVEVEADKAEKKSPLKIGDTTLKKPNKLKFDDLFVR